MHQPPRRASRATSVKERSSLPSGLTVNTPRLWTSAGRSEAVVDSNFSADYRWNKYLVSAGHNEVHNNPTLLTPSANQFTGRFDYGDANRRGLNAGFNAVYDYRRRLLLYATSQVTYNTDCCGISVQLGRINTGVRDETLFRIAFSVANVGSFGTLRKQDRLF